MAVPKHYWEDNTIGDYCPPAEGIDLVIVIKT